MKKNIKYLLLSVISCYSLLFFAGPLHAQPKYTVRIITTVIPPVNPYTEFSFANLARGINVEARNLTDNQELGFLVIAKLERLSPSPFTIERNPTNVMYTDYLWLNSFGSLHLSKTEMYTAFANFTGPPTLLVSGIALNDLKDSTGGVRLPPGQYRICFYAVDLNDLGVRPLSDPNTGCAFFTVCNTEPPQFIQPVNNLNFNTNYPVVATNSPVTFTWTPPWSACGLAGLVSYELEIREIFNNQNVTDAINNPLVFQKADILSTTFILDLNLYRDVLQSGKKYAIRVKATPVNPIVPVVVENSGYSRVEAFQFGSENALTPNPYWNAQSLYIPAEERKTGYWEDYATRTGRDTMVPMAEYIAYQLMQNGVAYNLDAIELMLSLNPEWKGLTETKLKQPVNLPEFPSLTAKEREEFELLHAANLKTSASEVILFRKLLDSLKASRSQEVSGLIRQLDQFNARVTAINSVTLNFINSLLSELLFELRRTGNEANHLRSVIADLEVLTEDSPSASLLKQLFNGRTTSLSHVNFVTLSPEYFAVTEPLLPFDIIVYRPALPPAKPVMNAPDLKGVYRIFYTTRTLYNNKNPEINAKSPGRLASTTQASLPRGIKYKFWTLNMLNHKLTLPQDVDVDDIFSKKADMKGKRSTVVLKVE